MVEEGGDNQNNGFYSSYPYGIWSNPHHHESGCWNTYPTEPNGKSESEGPVCEKGACPCCPITVISHVEDVQMLWGGCLALAPPRLSDDLIRLLNPVVSWRREKIG